MITSQETRAALRQFHQSPEPNAIAGEFYVKLAIKTYYDAIRNAPYRSREDNEAAITVAYEFHAKALVLGVPEEAVDVPFFNLRKHWVPLLQGSV
jgi:hypothetical protein